MLFPIGTDQNFRHRPYVNLGLIAVNVLIFAGVWLMRSDQPYLSDPVFDRFMLTPWQPHLHQFFTYQFLHANIEHLLFNMLFLYVFGNAVEGRLGSLGYLAFYLAGGVAAGVGYALTAENRIIGASGSIAAVAGAFLALFPLTRIRMLFWLFIISVFEVPAILVIGFYFGRDLLSHLFQAAGLDMGNVAFLAHLSGNVFGFGVAMVLLWTRMLQREPYDFIALVDRWRRRREMRSVTRQQGAPWSGKVPGSSRKTKAGPFTEVDARYVQMRTAIRDALAEGDAHRAVDTYERLLADAPEQAMPRDAQMDLANQAMRSGRHGTAARAYELFLKAYPRDTQQAQVQLLLGLLYTRYLDQPDRARALLTEARDRLDGEERKLADGLLGELGSE